MSELATRWFDEETRSGSGAIRPGSGCKSTWQTRKNCRTDRTRRGGRKFVLFELVHPPCVEEIEPDYQEGLELWKAGDPEEARDALRYTLQVCPANLWVHVALGRIALEEFNDPDLARGHFGYAVDLVRKVLPANFSGRLPRERRANAPFYDAVEGLVRCFRPGRCPARPRV